MLEPSNHGRFREYLIPLISKFHGLYDLNYMISKLDPLQLKYLVDRLREILPSIWNVRVKSEEVHVIRRVDNNYVVIPLNDLDHGYRSIY